MVSAIPHTEYRNPMNEIPRTDKAWVEHWKHVGPKLAELRREELQNFRYEDHIAEIDALLEIGSQFGTPRLTSGLVELQRKLHASRS